MADGTKIEWTDATWNPVTGCSVKSPGCTNCYAMKLAGTRLKHVASRKGLTQESAAGPVWTGEVRFNESEIDKPLRWKKPRMIFVCAHGDLFHENVPDEWIDRVFAVMALAPQHIFQVLTKRSDRMRKYCSNLRGDDPRWFQALQSVRSTQGSLALQPAHDRLDDVGILPNVWLGVSVEDQRRADERIPDLLATPAAVRWISAEPLLGPLDLEHVECHPGFHMHSLKGFGHDGFCPDFPRLDWIVAGGESGPGARPMHPDWARSLRDQCAAADVPFFFKQWGEWSSDLDVAMRASTKTRTTFLAEPSKMFFSAVGKKAAGRTLDGQTHDAMPA